MTKLNDRIRAFSTVGEILKNLRPSELNTIYQRARGENNWFTEDNIDFALKGIQNYLNKEKLTEWTKNLSSTNKNPKEIGLVMAGNIPLVGFHDFLTVLISGHILRAKLSSQDSFLIKYMANLLLEIEPQFSNFLRFEDRLKGLDAIIATGSDNTARYFEYYFAKIPHIIRKNRTSIGVLSHADTQEELQHLGEDIFRYFGLGCRNIAKLFVPEHYNFEPLFLALQSYEAVMMHHKYQNNYDYNKSIYLVNREPHLDTGFMLFRETTDLVSPISVIYYETYTSTEALENKLKTIQDKIQCITSQAGWFPGSIPFGTTQLPELWDYADRVDTLDFVNNL